MGKINYIWDRYTQCMDIRENSGNLVKKFIENNRGRFTFLSEKTTTMGFIVNENEVLTKLYGFKIKNIDFAFYNYDDAKDSESRRDIYIMVESLRKYLLENKAYFIVKIPAHIHWLHRGLTDLIPEGNFRGGIATIYKFPDKSLTISEESAYEFIVDIDEIQRREKEIIDISNNTFKDYWGQYDLSEVTADKTSIIYKNWTSELLSNKDTRTMAIADQNKFLGYVAYKSTKTYNEGVLGGISTEASGKGVYKAMIREFMGKTFKEEKLFLNGVSMDNYPVLKTHYSLGTNISNITYNIHMDKR